MREASWGTAVSTSVEVATEVAYARSTLRRGEMGAATLHSVFGSAASHFRIPFRVLRRSSAGEDDELEQGAAGVWVGDGGLDRLATPPRAGRVLASSTANGQIPRSYPKGQAYTCWY